MRRLSVGLAALALVLMPLLSSAQSTSQSSQITPSGGPLYTCVKLTRSLSLGSQGDDVKALQQFLTLQPVIYPEGVVSGYYGALTQAAVQRWQSAHGIVSSGTPSTTGFGVVGPHTEAAMAQCANSVVRKGCAAPPIQPLATFCSAGTWNASYDANGCQVGWSCSGITNAPAQCPVTPQVPLISCSGYFSAVKDANGCTTSWECVNTSAPIGLSGNPAICGNTVAISCPVGEVANLGANCTQSCVPAPTNFSATPSSGFAPLTVSFNGNAAQGYTIDYGDGTSVPALGCDDIRCASYRAGISATHTYYSTGTFIATLYDALGESTTTIVVSSR